MKLTFGPKTFRGLKTFAAYSLAGGSPAVFYRAVRIGEFTEVSITTSLAEAEWYHWYLDGGYVGRPAGPPKTVSVPTGDQLRVECIPTADADFDPVANAPEGYPARRTLWWTRSLDADVAYYRVEQQADGGEWSVLAEVPPEADQWGFSLLTGRLDDLKEYAWRITPIDLSGNEGVPILIGPELVVRTPNAPAFSVEFQSETQTVEFQEVANG